MDLMDLLQDRRLKRIAKRAFELRDGGWSDDDAIRIAIREDGTAASGYSAKKRRPKAVDRIFGMEVVIDESLPDGYWRIG